MSDYTIRRGRIKGYTLIDKDGFVVDNFVTYEDAEEFVKKAYKKKPRKKPKKKGVNDNINTEHSTVQAT